MLPPQPLRALATAALAASALAFAPAQGTPTGPGAAPPAAGGGAPSLGMGLSGIADWSSELPFIDLMKSARPWTGHLPGHWGGWEPRRLAPAGFSMPRAGRRTVPEALTGV